MFIFQVNSDSRYFVQIENHSGTLPPRHMLRKLHVYDVILGGQGKTWNRLVIFRTKV